MITLPFTKMQGIGNDFMIVDATVNPFSLTREQIRNAADRHLGVGFDQLLVIAPAPQQRGVDFTCLIYNNDGSSAQQCGNGVRCVARFIHERGLSAKKEFGLLIHDKITRVFLESDDSVTVEMSEPYFVPAQIPFTTDSSGPPYHLRVDGKDIEFQVVGVGNPHAVILTKKIEAAVVAQQGGQLSRHPNFPEGVNVGFMQIETPSQILLQVNERGAGPTLACGSGACAAVAVGRRLGLLQEQVRVNQPGGEVWITWHGPGSPIRMRGPAQFVYEGNLFLAQS